jgi:hypothetical protein
MLDALSEHLARAQGLLQIARAHAYEGRTDEALEAAEAAFALLAAVVPERLTI